MSGGLDQTALVTIVGGSGFIGRYVVEELARTGARLRVAVRDPQAAGFLKPLGQLGQIAPIAADIRSDSDVAAAFDGATHGVNLVGILAESGKQTFAALQAEGAIRVAKAAAANGARGYVQISAIGADAASPARYARTKAAGEAGVLAALPTATILRPSLVFGREDGFTNRFAGLAGTAPVMPVVAGGTRFQPVYVRDVARAVVAALADPAAYGGRTYELGGPRRYAFRELVAWILREIGSTKSMIELPNALAALMGKAGDILPFLPMTSDQWAMLQRDNIVADGAPGLAELGVAATPLEAVAPEWLVRYRRGGRFATDRAA